MSTSLLRLIVKYYGNPRPTSSSIRARARELAPVLLFVVVVWVAGFGAGWAIGWLLP